MIDYKTMYYALFNTLTDAIELLKSAQTQGEQLFVEAEETLLAELVFPENQMMAE